MPSDPTLLSQSNDIPGHGSSLIAVALAVILVAVIDLMTPLQPPIADAVYYVNIANHGIFGNQDLAAPYAYRPAVPLLAGALADITGADPEDALLWITRVSAVLLLCIVYFFARSDGAPFPHALAVLCIVAFSLFHIKYPLYLPPWSMSRRWS